MMTPSLPRGFTQDKEKFLEQLAHIEPLPYQPPGSVEDSYTLHEARGPSDLNYESYFSQLSQDTRATAYFENMQKLSLWFIEGIASIRGFPLLKRHLGADDIDVHDTRWAVYVTYEKRRNDFYPIGFITLFTFHTPMKGPGKKSTRICQALVLPPYQRQGKIKFEMRTSIMNWRRAW